MPLQVVVNISPQTLEGADLPARVLATLLAAELPASLLQLEITETAVMSDPLRAVKTLRQSNARGVETVIDDLGAGYTSLARLRNLPFSGIEIDRSLVVGLPAQPEDEAVAHALIDLAGSTRWCDAADPRTRCRPHGHVGRHRRTAARPRPGAVSGKRHARHAIGPEKDYRPVRHLPRWRMWSSAHSGIVDTATRR